MSQRIEWNCVQLQMYIMIVLMVFVSTESVKQIIYYFYVYLCVYTIIGIVAVDASLYS